MGTVVHRANSDIDFVRHRWACGVYFTLVIIRAPYTLLALEFSDARHLSYPLPPSKQKSKSGNCQGMEGSPGQPPPPQNSVNRSHQGPESTKVWIGRGDGFQSMGWGLSYAEVLEKQQFSRFYTTQGHIRWPQVYPRFERSSWARSSCLCSAVYPYPVHWVGENPLRTSGISLLRLFRIISELLRLNTLSTSSLNFGLACVRMQGSAKMICIEVAKVVLVATFSFL